MPDRAIDVAPTGSAPWSGMTSCFRFGDLSSVLDLSGEHGFAAGPDLSDETQPNIVGTNSKVRIQFRGSSFGCLTFDEDDLSGIHASSLSNLDFTVRGSLVARMDANDGLSIFDETGTPMVMIRRKGDTWSTYADIHANVNLGMSAQHGIHFMMDSENAYTDRIFTFRKNGPSVTGSTPLLYIEEGHRFGMQYPGISHAATAIVRYGDTFTEISRDTGDSSNAGGLIIKGIKDSQTTHAGGSVQIRGYLEDNADTGKTATDRAIVEIYGCQLSGGAQANVVANGNILAVRALVSGAWANCIMVDAEGDLYYNGSTHSFDEEDDALAASDLYHILTEQEDRVVRYTRERLSKMRVINATGSIMASSKGVMALCLGSIRQIQDRQNTLIGAVERLSSTLNELEAHGGS